MEPNKGYRIIHRCGLFFTLLKFKELINKGIEYKKAWKVSKKNIKNSIKLGYFKNNRYKNKSLRTFTNDIKNRCSLLEIK